MKLDTPFYKLPLRFDPARLAAEVGQFAESEWRPHPQGHAGNTAIPLIAAHGDPDSDAVRGPMLPTPALERCPYLRQVLGALETVLGRARLMRIVGHGEATPHVDTNYYWLHHIRVHVPAVTTPGVRFVCDGRDVHMAAGECWTFDTWRLHNVVNPADASRVHLVADTVGSEAFWDALAGAERPFDPHPRPAPVRAVPFAPGAEPVLEFERFNFPVVMSPWEQECLIADLLEQAAGTGPADGAAQVQRLLLRFNRHWRALWAAHADSPPGWPAFASALRRVQQELAPWKDKLTLPNGVDLVEGLLQAVVRPGHNPDLGAVGSGATAVPGAPERVPARAAEPPVPAEPTFERPVVIVAAPRSGSTLLFETLARSPDLWTVGGESHELIEGVPGLAPADRGFDSNRLTAADATPEAIAAVRRNFAANLRDRAGRPPGPGAAVRLLEKTPKNALRVPFLDRVFPGALFVYLYREPRDNVSSAIDAWRSGRFVTYPDLPGWPGPPWSLLLTPGWRDLAGKPVEEAAAAQWRVAHEHILDDLGRVPRARWIGVSYSDLVSDPRAVAERIAAFAGVRWDDPLDGPLPHSRHTLTPPDSDKWKRNAAELERVLPGLAGTDRRARAAVAPAASGPTVRAVPTVPVAPPPHAAPAPSVASEPLRAVATSNFAPLLASLGVSLAVSTYQAGRLIILRADGDKLNTHFRGFDTPMGLALRDNRLALGAGNQVWQFQNQPAAARQLDPPGRHDACYLPRSRHYTGDIRVHDVAFAGAELWAVNTRFSCLCTFDADHSFVPRWRPSFVTALAPEDRCHLNGLAVRDGRPRYVTCLGATDTAGGWRANKRNGGLLIDVSTGAPLTTGLSMPHSPRWHQEKLWVLESGDGGIGHVDLATGRQTTIARLPGFTRGLDFRGHLAFVGLSQVRETAVFAGLPLTDRLEERLCGVWVVDLRDGGTVAFLRFESGVHETFAVQVLPARFPELLNENEEPLQSSFVLPDAALGDVPVSLRTGG